MADDSRECQQTHALESTCLTVPSIGALSEVLKSVRVRYTQSAKVIVSIDVGKDILFSQKSLKFSAACVVNIPNNKTVTVCALF